MGRRPAPGWSKDIRPGPDGGVGWPVEVAALDDYILFGANDGVHGAELWRSDGTEEGTFLVRDIVPGSAGSVRAYFSALFGADCSLWVTDGTEQGTHVVAGTEGVCPLQTMVSGSRLFFSANVHESGDGLWAIAFPRTQ
jgi:ELWxxDGT repeat protein